MEAVNLEIRQSRCKMTAEGLFGNQVFHQMQLKIELFGGVLTEHSSGNSAVYRSRVPENSSENSADCK